MRIASICAGVAFSPRRTRTGSVGMTLEIRKTMTTSPASVGTNHASRETIISRRRIRGLLDSSGPRASRAPHERAGRARSGRLLVIRPAHVLAAADRAEADAADV